MLPQDRIELYGDKPIEERAKLFSKMASDNYPYQHQLEVGYLNGATEQRKNDIDKACEFMYNFKLPNGVAPLYNYVGNLRRAMEAEL